MFEMVLRSRYNKTFIAKIDGQIAGTMSYTGCQHCQISSFDMLKLTPRLIRMFGSHLIPVLRWRMNWSRHDDKKEHVHFGPLAVDIYYQGQGMGKALLSRFCEYLDTTSQTAYLETDKAENVSLYEKFGFNVLQTDRIFSVTNWFMLRKQH
jgi:ribosomal protein S18 acetylase RimI-like enzyme